MVSSKSLGIGRTAILASALAISACSSTTDSSTPHATTTDSSTSSSGAGGQAGAGPIGGDRPVDVHVPPSYDGTKPMPLVILLHGYGASGSIQEIYMHLKPLSDKVGFLYAHPDGTVDKSGQRFWNATDACCNFDPSAVDDVSYLMGLVSQIEARYNVDPKRVHFVGHSNGGFMSHRLACEHGDRIASIASLAGDTWAMPSECPGKDPVAVLQIQGTADETVNYAGGSFFGHDYPGSEATAASWVAIDGCATMADHSAPNVDLVSTLPGDETTVTRYETGCKPGGGVELWTIPGGTHIPTLSTSFGTDVIDFLFAHPKP